MVVGKTFKIQTQQFTHLIFKKYFVPNSSWSGCSFISDSICKKKSKRLIAVNHDTALLNLFSILSTHDTDEWVNLHSTLVWYYLHLYIPTKAQVNTPVSKLSRTVTTNDICSFRTSWTFWNILGLNWNSKMSNITVVASQLASLTVNYAGLASSVDQFFLVIMGMIVFCEYISRVHCIPMT